MAKAKATVEKLVRMTERGELRLPKMQRRYVWCSTRVRDLLDFGQQRLTVVTGDRVRLAWLMICV